MYEEDSGNIKIVIKIPSSIQELESLVGDNEEESEDEVESVKSNADYYIKEFGCKRGK